MAVRIIRDVSMGTPLGGGNLTISSDGKTFEIEKVTRFGHSLSRFVESMPLPGGEEEGNPEAAAIVFDLGGVQIQYNFSFVLVYDDENDLYNDYRDIDVFFSTIPILSHLILEVDENGWTGENARSVVLKSFRLERSGGEGFILRGMIELLGGTAL